MSVLGEMGKVGGPLHLICRDIGGTAQKGGGVVGAGEVPHRNVEQDARGSGSDREGIPFDRRGAYVPENGQWARLAPEGNAERQSFAQTDHAGRCG